MIDYKGFTIVEDKLLGWSLIDRSGSWCCSSSSIDKLKETVDRIIQENHDCFDNIEYTSASLGACKKCGKTINLLGI